MCLEINFDDNLFLELYNTDFRLNFDHSEIIQGVSLQNKNSEETIFLIMKIAKEVKKMKNCDATLVVGTISKN